MIPAGRSPESRLIRRTARRIAAQIAMVFTVAILALAALAAVLVVRTQNNDAQQLLSQSINDTDVITNPPADVLVYQESSGEIRSSPGFTTGPLDPGGFAAVRAGGPTRTSSHREDGREYLVRTQRRGDTTIQASLDLTDQHRERDRLFQGVAAVSGVGLALALVVGWVIARRAITPLGVALTRQQRFVADASHELRTPLTQVHTRAQLLRQGLRGGADPGQLAEDADRLVQGTRQLGEIVEELLLSSQLRTGPATFGPVDLAAIAREVVDAEQARAADHDVVLQVSADGGTHLVRGSATSLRRVLNALVDNALDHTPPRGRVSVALSTGAGRVSCVVQDNGTGFDADDADRIFERFAHGGVPAHSVHGGGRRFGLGLALVREVLTAHAGTVEATGQPGRGATFTVTLPGWDHP